MRERNHTFDLVSGVLILWMVFFHTSQWSQTTSSVVYRFGLVSLFMFMPWFFFRSGSLQLHRGFLGRIRYQAINLIPPILIWFLVGVSIIIASFVFVRHQPLSIVIRMCFEQYFNAGTILGNPPLWFAVILFLCSIIPVIIHPLLNMFVFLALGMLFHFLPIQIPFGIEAVFLGGLFFFFGVFLQNITKGPNTALISILVLFTVLSQIFLPSFVDIRTNQLDFGYYLLFALNSLLILFVIHSLSPLFSIPPLNWIGQRSSAIFFIHWPVLVVSKWILTFFHLSTTGILVCIVFFFFSISIPLSFTLLFPNRVCIRNFQLRIY